MSLAAAERDSRPKIAGSLGQLGLQALGVVFGDIATSPLYTLKTVLDVTGSHPNAAAVMGSLSLIVWTLVIVTTIKYVNIAMRIDNDGEGEIVALMTLLTSGPVRRPLLVACGLFGAALLYGDGAITPAISVLSALEGVDLVTPAFQSYVMPGSIVILLGLFLIQRQGTERIGGAFGPIMAPVASRHRGAGHPRHPALPGHPRGPRSALRPFLSGQRRTDELPGAWRGIPLRDRRRGALCRHGTFRGEANPLCVVRGRVSEPGAQLCGTSRHHPCGRIDARKHFLPAVSPPLAHSAHPARDGGHHHRQPVHHHRRLLHDAPGDPARLAAAPADPADIRARLWPDLCRRR